MTWRDWLPWLYLAGTILQAVGYTFAARARFFAGCARGVKEGFDIGFEAGQDIGYVRALQDDETTRREKFAEINRRLA